MRILITGTRYHPTAIQLHDLVNRLYGLPQGSTVVHGAAPGVDSLAAAIATALGLQVEPHPADWDQYGKPAGPKRNAEMVVLGADEVWAYPIANSRGTINCMNLAVVAGLSVVRIDEEGEINE